MEKLICSLYLGVVFARSGKFENAMNYFDQSLRLNRAIGDRFRGSRYHSLILALALCKPEGV